MTIIELGALGEFVGAFAVVATLIYLALQVKHSKDALNANTRATTATSVSTSHQLDADFHRLVAQEDVAEVFVRGLTDYPDLSLQDEVRFNSVLFTLFNSYEARFYQSRDVTQEGLSGSSWAALRYQLRLPGSGRWWKTNGTLYSNDFAEFVDAQDVQPAIKE